ncbi:DUF6232 family protein [Streptomyces sp. NPDC006798]|uniref:DUF6232 family protein n=1 Tax=Streptomyces sp. NPDC006798 TaxID=3155462 RepID=UPI0034105A06
MSRQILTIGSSFYPLQSVARVSSVEWTIRLRYLVWPAAKALALAIALWIGSAVADAASAQAGVVVGLAAVVATGFAGYRIVQITRRRTYYGLVIETAGDPHTALVNDDPKVIADIAGKIMAAINDPSVTFQQTVNNFKMGDTVHGDKVMGDKTMGNKIMGDKKFRG